MAVLRKVPNNLSIIFISGGIRTGLVFDGMTSKEDSAGKGSHTSNKSTFGSRPRVRLPPLNTKSKPKQTMIHTIKADGISDRSSGKENIPSTTSTGT